MPMVHHAELSVASVDIAVLRRISMQFAKAVLAQWPVIASARALPVPVLQPLLAQLRQVAESESADIANAVEWPGPARDWGWMPLQDKPGIRTGLLMLRAGQRIPVHDHPDSVAVSLLLSGRGIVSTFQVPEVVRSGAVLSLRVLGRRLVNPGRSGLALPALGNAHALSALIDSVFLEIIVSPRRPTHRHWYFPAGHEPSSREFFTAVAIRQFDDGHEQMPSREGQ